jgi:Domain of unknown function (DUF4126)
VDWPSVAATGLGSAWLSGLNLYATVLTLGLLQRVGLARLPGDLAYLSEGWVIGLAALLYLIEFVADKVPAVDSIWDGIHTFIRVPAGAVLATSAFADFDTPVRIAALLIGGGLALGAHGSKAATRVAVNATAPGAGIVLSLAEDAATVGSTLLMAFFPVVFLALAVGLTAWLAPKMARAFRVRRQERARRRTTRSG